MYVGILYVHIRVTEAFNLKDKRRVLKSVFDKVRNKFQFSAAEVGQMEMINISEMGFSCVSNSYSHIEDRLSSLEKFLEEDFRFEILSMESDIIKC